MYNDKKDYRKNNRKNGHDNNRGFNSFNDNFYGSPDKEPKKDYRRRTTHQPNGLPKNERIDIPVSCYGITMDGKEYEGASFIDMMNDLQNNNVFNKISIPVYTKASYATDNPTAKWNTVLGYIKGFNDDGTATCVIYAKSIKIFHKIEDAIIVPRVTIKDGKCVCIIGLDIVSTNDINK